MRPARLRELARWLIDEYRISIRRASAVVMLARSTNHYRPTQKDEAVLIGRIREIAITRFRYGYWRIYTLLRREGWMVNHKRIYRLYKLEGLNLRSKRPRRNQAAARWLDRIEASRPHQSWSMDFVADQLFDGHRFRALAIVDNFSRKCLAIQVDQSIKGDDVRTILARMVTRFGQLTERIQVDNGSGIYFQNR